MTKASKRRGGVTIAGTSKRRGGILTLLDPNENPITDDLIDRAATPKLRKQLRAFRDFRAYEIAHPMDPRPMREADALARKGLPEPKQLQIGSAVEEAMKYGLEIGRRAGLFGIDAISGRDHLRRMSNARDVKAVAAAARHVDWQTLADTYWRENPDLTAELVARRILKVLEDNDSGEFVPTKKTIQNNIRKPT
jgi:hypothetical protein